MSNQAKPKPSKRRYPRGENPEYDDKYNIQLRRSWILNPGIRERDIRYAGRLTSRGDIESAILELRGAGESGKVYNSDLKEYELAEIPAMENELQAQHAIFEDLKYRKKLQGYDPATFEMPQHIKEKITELEAALDVRNLELNKLSGMFKPYAEQDHTERLRRLLPKGPHGNAWGEPLKVIDGQQVGWIDNVLCIVDELSPYEGMSVIDYRAKVIKPYVAQRLRMVEEANAKRKKEFEEHDRYKTPSVDLRTTVERKDLPKWPENVKNHLLKDEKDDKS